MSLLSLMFVGELEETVSHIFTNSCLKSEQATQPPPAASKPQQQQPREVKFKSLHEAVDTFINDLMSGSSTITIFPLDSSGSTSFSYLGRKFRLDVPTKSVDDNVILQTWFDHSKKAAGISGRVVSFNAAMQKLGLGGKLTFRNMNGKYAFTYTKPMDPERFSKTILRHGIEYFMEMSFKLHNTINIGDVLKVDKIRLSNSVATQ